MQQINTFHLTYCNKSKQKKSPFNVCFLNFSASISDEIVKKKKKNGKIQTTKQFRLWQTTI